VREILIVKAYIFTACSYLLSEIEFSNGATLLNKNIMTIFGSFHDPHFWAENVILLFILKT